MDSLHDFGATIRNQVNHQTALSINTTVTGGSNNATTAVSTTTPPVGSLSSSPTTLSRYENQKRRDWNTFGQYLRNHRPPLSLSRCSGAHVLEFLRATPTWRWSKLDVERNSVRDRPVRYGVFNSS
ncbi:hypothetical protein ACFE04_005124 [Oxalis oulophora]